MKKRHAFWAFMFTSLLAFGEVDIDDELFLDELMNMTVSSVTATESKLKDTPAAVYVITAEDIKKAGHQSIPEALRIVPGLQVTQTTSNIWSISSRGFNGRYTDKLLVMIDGRSVYSTLFSGVFWEMQDVLLEDIERIEVVRGPGATLWGANAVNGVINIITKKVKDTQGTYLKLGAGTHHQGFGAIRHGDSIEEDKFYRFSLKYKNLDHTETAAGVERPDDWELYTGSLRFDWEISKFTELTLQTDFSHSNRIKTDATVFNNSPAPFPALSLPSQVLAENQKVNNHNILLALNHEFSAQHRISLRSYFDNAERTNPIVDDKRRTYDIDFKSFYICDENNQFVWGLAYRSVHDQVDSSSSVQLNNERTIFNTASALVEYTHHLLPDELIFTLGSKFEVNSYTGFEVQPNARLAYHLNDNDMLWASFSRSVRTPARYEDTANVNMSSLQNTMTLPFHSAFQLRGNSQIKAEILHAYELGYRSQLNEKISLDMSLFYNQYSDLTTYVVDQSTTNVFTSTTPIILNLTNQGSADSYGFEVSSNWQVNDDWRLGASYTFFRSDEDNSEGPSNNLEGSAPINAANLHSHYQIHESLSFHTHAYYKDNIVIDNISQYIRLDTGLIWEIKKDLEMSFWAQNLLDDSHIERKDNNFGSDESHIQRSFYAQLTAKF